MKKKEGNALSHGTERSDGEILKKAVEKAEGNGYRVPRWKTVSGESREEIEEISGLLTRGGLMSRDFAMALFGEDWYAEKSPEQSNQGYYSSTFDTDDVTFQGTPWAYHLQQMVLSEDPIRYLEIYLYGKRK